MSVVITLGLLVPLTAGDFDLSIAFNLTLSSVVLAELNVNDHWPIIPAMVVVLLLGATIGAVNASIMLFFGIDPFIVTLGTGTFLGGLALWITDNNTITGISPRLVNALITHKFLDIPLEFYYGLALCVLLWYVLDFTPLGRHLLIVGRARTVARLSGINVPADAFWRPRGIWHRCCTCRHSVRWQQRRSGPDLRHRIPSPSLLCCVSWLYDDQAWTLQPLGLCNRCVLSRYWHNSVGVARCAALCAGFFLWRSPRHRRCDIAADSRPKSLRLDGSAVSLKPNMDTASIGSSWSSPHPQVAEAHT